jgi:hypothetical protein
VTLRQAPWLVGLAVCLGAVTLAATAPGAGPTKPLTDDVARAIFVELAQGEPQHRLQAAEDFACDPWSRDDHFAVFEATRSGQQRDRYGLAIQDVYRAFDDGLRQRWSLPEGTERPRAWVAPLRPRPFD